MHWCIRQVVLAIISAQICFWTAETGYLRRDVSAQDSRPIQIQPKPLCNEMCTCVRNGSEGVRVDCSRRNLESFPENLPADTVELVLSHNHISRFTAAELAGCSGLVKLDLSFNDLEGRLEHHPFESATNLQQIILNDNKMNVTYLVADVFSNVKNLTTLHIHNNRPSKHRKFYNDALFGNLTQLGELSMDGIDGASFKNISRLHRLQSLHIEGSYRVINNKTFRPFEKLTIKRLKLSTGRTMKFIYDNPFASFPHLEELDLSDNSRIRVAKISHAWQGTTLKNLTKLILVNIDSTSETNLTTDFFQNLDATKLETLIIEKNGIVDCSPNFATSVPHLKILSLSGNKIRKPLVIRRLAMDISELQQLRLLDVSQQMQILSSFFELPPANDGDPSDIIERFQQVGRYEQQPAANLKQDLSDGSCYPSGDNCSRTNASFDQKGPWCVPLPPQLQTLNITASLNSRAETINPTVPLTVFFGGRNLRLIICRSNQLQNITGPISLQPQPDKLGIDLSFNKIHYISPSAFVSDQSPGGIATELYLSNNRLGKLFDEDREGRTLRNLTRLEVLNLANNKIHLITDATFADLQSLRILNLSGNLLSSVEFDVRFTRHFRFLDLSRNDLRSIDQNVTDQLSAKMKSDGNGLLVDLDQNPLRCSCRNLHFVHWMHEFRANLFNFERYACQLNDTSEANVRVHVLDPAKLDFECTKQLTVIVSATLLGLVLILITGFVCCYRYRWEVRYCCLKLTHRGKQYQLIVDSARDYDYDAFVVYNSDDRDWVNGQLVKHLEGNEDVEETASSSRADPRSIRLCVHERDFPPGEDIVGNIWSRMERSRKTIVVLSMNFTRSKFCNYEAELARLRSVEVARNVIVPVLLEPVDIAEMSECLRWIVRKLTYIEWPKQETDRAEFWQKLRSVVTNDDVKLLEL